MQLEAERESEGSRQEESLSSSPRSPPRSPPRSMPTPAQQPPPPAQQPPKQQRPSTTGHFAGVTSPAGLGAAHWQGHGQGGGVASSSLAYTYPRRAGATNLSNKPLLSLGRAYNMGRPYEASAARACTRRFVTNSTPAASAPAASSHSSVGGDRSLGDPGGDPGGDQLRAMRMAALESLSAQSHQRPATAVAAAARPAGGGRVWRPDAPQESRLLALEKELARMEATDEAERGGPGLLGGGLDWPPSVDGIAGRPTSGASIVRPATTGLATRPRRQL